MYNMYALARNTWKFGSRDKRKRKLQHVEFDSLAPDTAEEIFAAMALLERWPAQAALRADGRPADQADDEELTRTGRQLLADGVNAMSDLEVLAENVEHSQRKVVVLKARQAHAAYRQMLLYYAVKNLIAYLQANADVTPETMADTLAGPRQEQWVNLGGQLVAGPDVDTLREDVRTGKVDSWQAVHDEYDRLWAEYPLARCRHALATLTDLLGIEALDAEAWASALDQAVEIQKTIAEQTYQTRRKDDDNPFRQMSYDCPEQMQAVLGSAQANSFVTQVREATDTFARQVEAIRPWSAR